MSLQARLMTAVIGFVSLILVIVAVITSATLGSTLEDQEEYDTVGGLIYHRIGGIPKAGDVVTVGEDLTLTVESTDGRRVEKVLAVFARPEAEGEDEPAS